MRSFYFASDAPAPTIAGMSNRERVISVELSEEEWRALLRVQPQPVAWLRERISEAIASSRPTAAGAGYTTSARSH